jgi:hypothetical protein
VAHKGWWRALQGWRATWSLFSPVRYFILSFFLVDPLCRKKTPVYFLVIFREDFLCKIFQNLKAVNSWKKIIKETKY